MDAQQCRRYLPRFSLRTLLILVLLAASGFGLWWKWEPWVISLRLAGDTRKIRSIAYSPDSTKLLTYSYDDPTAIVRPGQGEAAFTIWDVATGEQIARFKGEIYEDLKDLRFSKNGRWVIAEFMHLRHRMAFLDTTSGTELFSDMPKEVDDWFATSPDEEWVLARHGDRVPELWDLERGERRYAFEVIGMNADCGCFSASGKRVALGGFQMGQRVVVLFDTETGKQLQMLTAPLESPIRLTPDDKGVIGRLDTRSAAAKAFVGGMTLESATNATQIELWNRTCLVNLESGKPVRTVADRPAYRPQLHGGHFLVFEGDVDCVVRETNTLGKISRLAGQPTLRPVTSPDGECIVLTNVSGSTKLVGTIRITECNIKTGMELSRIEFQAMSYEALIRVSYEKEGRRIVAVTSTRTVVWDSGTGNHCVDFDAVGLPSPDGRRVLLWKQGDDLRIGDMDSGGIPTILKGTAATELQQACFHPSGDQVALAFGGPADEVMIWTRRRPEEWWGAACVPEFWLTFVFGIALIWSLRRDWKTLRGKNVDLKVESAGTATSS